jgi:threonine dehydratase
LKSLKRLVTGGFAVSDDEVRDAMRAAFHYFKLVVEPGGAVAFASALKKEFEPLGSDVVVAIVRRKCG